MTPNDKEKPATPKKEKGSFDFFQTLLLNALAERLKVVNREDFLKVMKEEGTQAVSDILADIMTNQKFKDLKNVKKEDVVELFKRHGLQKALKYGQNIIKETFKKEPSVSTPVADSAASIPATSVASVEKVPTVSQQPSTSAVLTDKTNFGEFVGYVLNNPAYKDAYSDSKIVSFIASQSAHEDIVLGHAPRWDKVIQQSRLLASSGLDPKASQRMTAQFVESVFDKETAQKFKEHFGLAKPVATKSSTARKKAKM